MDKKIIYLEPDNDITDLIAKLKSTPSKEIFIVAPKVSALMKSAVNMKLLAKHSNEQKKTLTIVSADPAIKHLAQSAGLKVASDAEGAEPVAPVEKSPTPTTPESAAPATISKSEAADLAEDADKMPDTPTKAEVESEVIESAELEAENTVGKSKKSKMPSFAKWRWFFIIGSILILGLIGFLVWAIIFAPSANIEVKIKTTTENFSKYYSGDVKFTTDSKKPDPASGYFLLVANSVTKTSSVEIIPTGERNSGDKAKGTITFTRTADSFNSNREAITIPSGSKFTYSGKTYITTASATLAAVDSSAGGNASCSTVGAVTTCTGTKPVIATAALEAEGSGASYNIAAATTSGWTPANGTKYTLSASAITGGTDKITQYITEADVKAAENNLSLVNDSDARDEILGNFPDTLIAIRDSFTSTHKDAVPSIEVGKDLPEDAKPELKAESTFTIYGIERQEIEDFMVTKIKEGIASEANRTIFSTGIQDVYIERFVGDKGEFTGKIRSSQIKIGPNIDAQFILDKSLGQKVGNLRTQLASINGVANVVIDTSFFWVTSIPDDANKVTIVIESAD